jgi:hypothetical protein
MTFNTLHDTPVRRFSLMTFDTLIVYFGAGDSLDDPRYFIVKKKRSNRQWLSVAL